MAVTRSLLGRLLVLCVPGLLLGREVRVQPGPLYRALGNAATIRCNVSDYEGTPTQNFEWFVYRPSAPDISIAIASTKDPDFSYAVYAQRVQRGEVGVRRLSGDSAELHIKSLRADDEGVYECYTPTTDSQYRGSYSAKVALKVMEDALQVSVSDECVGGARVMEDALQVSVSDDCVGGVMMEDALQVSVSDECVGGARGEYVGGARVMEDALQVSVSDECVGGVSYECVGGVRVMEDALQVSVSDECVGGVSDEYVGGVRDTQMKVLVTPREVHVQTGGSVDLLCNVSLPLAPPPDVVLSVDWWVSSGAESPGQRVISLGTDGAVSLGERYEGGEAGTRHISLERLASGTFRLRIYSTQPGDIGAYSCHVTAFVSYPGPRLQEVTRKVSPSANILTTVQEISMSAEAWLDSATLYHGDTAALLCNVSLETPQTVHVAVSWWAELAGEEPNERTGRLLAAVNRHGVLEAGSRPSGQDLAADKVGEGRHRLRLFNVRPGDEGAYHCAVTAWVQYPDRTWYNAALRQPPAIKLHPYTHAMDMMLIPMVAGVASALFVGVTILSAVTCCYMRRLRVRKR
ncbi:LOW QUALITY PROTEIN: immunoglobulin superfamily member 8 [Gastrophryne carolinensis]